MEWVGAEPPIPDLRSDPVSQNLQHIYLQFSKLLIYYLHF